MKYFIKTYGCQMNYSDSERIERFAENINLIKASAIEEADLVIINTCGVRQMAEDRIYGLIHNLRKKSKKQKIILTGCIAHRKDVQLRMKNKVDLFCETKNLILKLAKLLGTDKYEDNDYLEIKPKYTTSFSASIPILTGCNNFCSYCVVPYARGREISRPAKKIINEVKNLIKKGCKEITLLGQNVNSYQDNKINFNELLKKIDAIPGNFWIRFLTSHPKDMSDDLIENIAKCQKVCEFVHLPIQAGSDKILKKMNRKYTAKHYLNLIAKIKKAFEKYKPGKIYSLSSDIIVGFPGETKKQFLDSAKIMEKVKYDMVYFGQFSPRQGTQAFKMKDSVSKKEKVRREKYLNEILKKTTFKNNQQYLGKNLDVLIEKGKNGLYFGKTRTMKNIKISTDRKNLIGKIVQVNITKANIWNLEGKIK